MDAFALAIVAHRVDSVDSIDRNGDQAHHRRGT
jgi:hypothetical protein